MKELKIIKDNYGNEVVVLPKILFNNKQNIDWNEVECYLQRYVGELVEIVKTKDRIYIGNKFPDEYSNSRYTRRMKGARAKAKANAAQGVKEMIEIASQKVFCENHKQKHSEDAKNGWYYYITRFAVPLYDNKERTGLYNIYSANLIINQASNGRMYLYDIVDIKKEASNPLKTNE